MNNRYVSTDADFKKVSDGGCSLACKATMKCGHVCPRLCHPYTHDKLLCQAPCTRKHLECDHLCERRYSPPPPSSPLLSSLSLSPLPLSLSPLLSHPLSFSPLVFRCFEECGLCLVMVEKDLTCGHTTSAPCAEPRDTIRCMEPCEKRYGEERRRREGGEGEERRRGGRVKEE